MLKIRTNLQSNDNVQNLGQIVIELTEVDYNRIVEYVMPIVFEEAHKGMNQKQEKEVNPLVKTLFDLFYQEKKLSMEAIKAAVMVFPTPVKEKLIKAVLRNDVLQDKVRQVLTPYGLSFGRIEVVDD